MAARLHERSALALAALQLFPPSIRESLSSDPVFQDRYSLTKDTKISFGDSGVWVQRSKLFNGIREVLAGKNTQPLLKDTTGMEWWLVLMEKEKGRQLRLSHGERHLFLPDFSFLSPDQTERMNGFNREANDFHLPVHEASRWRAILTSRALTDDETDLLHTEIEQTPIRVAAMIESDFEKGTSNVSTLVPCSERYFARLVGDYQQSQTLAEYAHAGAREHIRQLMSWRAYDGFLLSLLLSSHSSMASAIKADDLEEKDILQAYEWLQERGDSISQIGAIEIGLSILDKQPKIEHYVRTLIERIRDDNAKDDRGRTHLISALIVLVEGELSRTKILRRKPPFWRRLASIAQASLIERCIIRSQVDIAEFAKWAMQGRGQFFYLQTMVDLRQEPRWDPDYISPHQMKAEFIGRIISAAHKNASKIESPALQEVLFGRGPEGIHSLIKFPFPFMPGPLEGSLESQIEPPAEILRNIEERLSTDVLGPSSFAVLVNSALLFRLDSQYAALAAKALRTVKHQLRQTDNKERLFPILRGLATVAAVTRSDDLAKELRILTWRCRNEPGRRLSAEEALWIGLIAAAAHSELIGWCEFVGEWITELAFQSLEHNEIARLHSHVVYLSHIVPELWRTCGRAEAALNAAVGT